MNYKAKRGRSVKEYQNFGMYKPKKYFIQREFTFDQNEWISKIEFFINQFSEENYDIYPLYQYISLCNYALPYEMLIESQLLNILLNHFNQLVSNMVGKMKLNQVLLIPENNINEVDPYLIIFFGIFTNLLQTNFLIENEFFNPDFFFSLSKLCVYRNAYCYVKQEGNKKYSLCIESLIFAKLLFEMSPSTLFEFEENIEFSRILYTQYKMARVFEIKYYSLNALLPWMSHFPGNEQIFDLFCQEMTKTIKGENSYIFNVKTANEHYKEKEKNEENSEYDDLYDHFFKGTENYIKKSEDEENENEEDFGNETENGNEEEEENFDIKYYEDASVSDTEFNNLDNKFDIISLFLYGFLLFIQFRAENNEEEEEEEDSFSPYATMDYALDNGIMNFATSAILSNHEKSIVNGFKIVNLYLLECRVTEDIVMAFLEEIRDRIPNLLYFSKKVCHEETIMLTNLLEKMPEDKFETFFDQQFMHYLLHVLDDKGYQWKRNLIDFIGQLMIQMNFEFIEFLINEVNIIEIFSDVCETADEKIIDSIFDGICRIIQNESLKNLLIEKGIKDEIINYIENPNYSEKAQVILQFIQPDDF